MSISPLKNISIKEDYPNFSLRRSSVQENLNVKADESFGKAFRSSFRRLSLRKKPAKEIQDLETKTNESFRKEFRNSFRRLSLRKKPAKETQGSEDKGLLRILEKHASLENSDEFLNSLKKIKEAHLDISSSNQNPLMDVKQKIKEDYLFMKACTCSFYT